MRPFLDGFLLTAGALFVCYAHLRMSRGLAKDAVTICGGFLIGWVVPDVVLWAVR